MMSLMPLCLNLKKKKSDPVLYHVQPIHLKWIKDLSVRAEIVQLLEENRGKKLLSICLGNDFLDTTSKAQETKVKINKWVTSD